MVGRPGPRGVWCVMLDPPGVSRPPGVRVHTREGYGESYYTRAGYSRSFCISEELYKKDSIASLSRLIELVRREEKSVTTAVRFD